MDTRPVVRVIGLVEETVAVLLLIAMSAIVLLQVIGRYILTNPFIWTEELTRLLMIWLTFIAAAAVTRRGMHIAVDLGLDMMPAAMRRIVAFLIDLVMAATFFWLAYLMVRLALQIQSLPLAATRWSMSVMVWPAMVGSLLIGFHSVIRLMVRLGLDRSDIPLDPEPEGATKI